MPVILMNPIGQIDKYWEGKKTSYVAMEKSRN